MPSFRTSKPFLIAWNISWGLAVLWVLRGAL